MAKSSIEEEDEKDEVIDMIAASHYLVQYSYCYINSEQQLVHKHQLMKVNDMSNNLRTKVKNSSRNSKRSNGSNEEISIGSIITVQSQLSL